MNATKVFGIGMSKTGTTTLGRCLELLGFTPHVGFEPSLKAKLNSPQGVEEILRVAEKYRCFEDSPWYHLYRELDQRFPGSKFVLTVRRDSLTHAKSSWTHGTRRGVRSGEATAEYIAEKIRVYEEHNAGVREYFKDRPQDLLEICWEAGDGWQKLCAFLNVPVPSVPIPHCNQGRYRSRLPLAISRSKPFLLAQRTLYRFALTPAARWVMQRGFMRIWRGVA